MTRLVGRLEEGEERRFFLGEAGDFEIKTGRMLWVEDTRHGECYKTEKCKFY